MSMNIEINIGREAEGQNAIKVPSNCKKVSRHHAKIIWLDGEATIEDNESSNGTFVNSRRVARTKVKENDTVWLGGINEPDCYDMQKVFALFKQTENSQRTDYSKEFVHIRQAYIDYHDEETKIKNNQNVKMRLVNFIPMIVGGIFGLLPIPEYRFIGLAIGIVITLVLLSKSNNHDINEEITELQIKYQPRYSCPKCGMKYPFTTHWRKLEDEGKCPNPRCDAEFVKK